MPLHDVLAERRGQRDSERVTTITGDNWQRRTQPLHEQTACDSWKYDWKGSRLRRNAQASSRWSNEAHQSWHANEDQHLTAALEKESVRMDYDRALAGTRFRRLWDNDGIWKKHHDAVFRDPHHPMHEAAHISQRQFPFGTRFGQVDGGSYIDGNFSYLPTHLAFADLDANNDGKIDRDEWIAKYGNDDEFDSYDLDGDGFIDLNEFKHVKEWGSDAAKYYASKWGASCAAAPAGPAPKVHEVDPLEALGTAADAHRVSAVGCPAPKVHEVDPLEDLGAAADAHRRIWGSPLKQPKPSEQPLPPGRRYQECAQPPAAGRR